MKNGVFNWEQERDDWGSMVVGVELKHLRQLQNLYFALAGNELEIDLIK